MIQYQHRQFGKILFVILGTGILLCLILALRQSSSSLISLGITLILLLSLILFSSLAIEVTDAELRWTFGPGLIQKSVKLSEIDRVEITQTNWIEGWGIHLTSRGWLYNVAGFQAVAIQLKNHQQFLLGTDEPEQLVSVLRKQLTDTEPE
jgi:hypothetical protein